LGSEEMPKERPFYAKYPFMVSLDEYLLHTYGTKLAPNDLLELQDLKEQGLLRVKAALGKGSYLVSFDEDQEVISFYLALLLASATDPWALYKYADTEAKRAVNFMLGDKDKVISIVAGKLGVELEYFGSESDICGHRVVIGTEKRTGKEVIECYPFRVIIPTYLRLTESLASDPKWKLVNRCVIRGYVYLNKRDAARMLETAIKSRITYLARELISTTNIDPELIMPEVNELKELVRNVRGFLTSERDKFLEELRGQIVEKFFPPCITEIMNTLLKGEHLSHHQRFALATFLLNIGADVDYVLNLMRNLPDFNERIARYQVEHLAGLRGSRKKYSMYSCEKMKTLGMCVADCGVKNPLQYYWRQLRASRKAEGGKTVSSRSQERWIPSEP